LFGVPRTVRVRRYPEEDEVGARGDRGYTVLSLMLENRER
jgi:hypothetical protein